MLDFKRPSIKAEERLKLWVRSGGRCAICNKYLLEDEYFEVPLGEMAHIVAWKDAKKAPRGKSTLSSAERNRCENLILMCADDHKIIDYKKLPDLFTIEALLLLKRQHEERIFHLTQFKKDNKTTVIRIFGRIRETSVELARHHTFEVVWKQIARFAYFPLTFDKSSIEINLNNIPDPEIVWDSYWTIGCSIIDECIPRIKEGVNRGEIEHLSVFGFCRIPLLTYLGYQLGDKIPIEIFQKQRGGDETWLWPNDTSPESFEYNQVQTSSNLHKVALIVSMSGTIAVNELPENIKKSFNIYEIKPLNTIPNRDIISSKKSLDNFSKCYHLFFSYLENRHKAGKCIHVFLAVPTSIAILIGRGVMRHAQPELKIYDRTNNEYRLTFSINKL